MKQQTKNFIQNLKEFEKKLEPLETYIKEEYMEGDKAVVYVNCLNEEEIFETYSFQSQKSLNSAIYNHLIQLSMILLIVKYIQYPQHILLKYVL